MKRHLSTSKSELHFHGPLRSQMCRCQAPRCQGAHVRIRARTATLNTGTSEASVMREDRDRVGVFHGTLSMITGTFLRGFSHLDAAELQASYGGSALFLHAHRTRRLPQHATWARLKGSTLMWVFWGCCSSLTHNASVVLTGSNMRCGRSKKQDQSKTWSCCWRRSLSGVNALFRFSRLQICSCKTRMKCCN